MKLLSTLLLAAMSLANINASDFSETGYQYMNTIIDNHLKLKVEPNE